jgi:hypothetical protein
MAHQDYEGQKSATREQTLLERLVEAEHSITRLTRIVERSRDRLDSILGSEPEPPEVIRESRY